MQKSTAAKPQRRDDCLDSAHSIACQRLTAIQPFGHLFIMITPFTMCLTRTQAAQDQACGVCGAEFVPAEDSGSRQLSLMPADKEPFSVLMCGGCHSKWSHGVTVTVRRGGGTSVAPVLRHPERG